LCAVTTSLHILYELNRNAQTSQQKVHHWKLENNLLFADDLVLRASYEQGRQHALNRFLLVTTRKERKSALKIPRYHLPQETEGSAWCD